MLKKQVLFDFEIFKSNLFFFSLSKIHYFMSAMRIVNKTCTRAIKTKLWVFRNDFRNFKEPTVNLENFWIFIISIINPYL